VVTRRGRLDAVELDADQALARWLAPREDALRAIAERGTYLDDADVQRLLRLALPGIDELMALVELTRLAAGDRYDDVVVDTAPTGHTLRLLTMPETLRRIAGVLDGLYAKHRFLSQRLAGRYRADASDAVIAELDEHGRALHDLLRDPARCVFSWVLLPETLAVEETRDGVRELDRAGLAVCELVVNRVWRPTSRRCPRCAAKARAEGQAIRTARRAFPGRPLRLVPALPREPRGAAGLRVIADHLRARTRTAMLGGHAGHGEAAERPAAPPGAGGWLDVLAPPGARLILVTGKGGVGKTTCAAALGLGLARASPTRRLLLLSTDPAHSLGDALDVSLGDHARGVPGAPPALRARELDATGEFERQRARYRAAVAELFGARGSDAELTYDRAVVEELVDLAPPGIDELFAVLAVTEALDAAVRRGRPEVVVVDTAPTGHTLRLLALPEAALAWVRALLSILLKYRAVLRPGRLASDLIELAGGLRRLARLLRDARRTRVVVVARPGALPRLETRRLLQGLGRLGLGVAGVIANALPVAGRASCRRCARLAAAASREAAALAAGRPLIRAPETIPPPRGIAALARWSRTWAVG
jgi:arsenite-transporting ATPase